jgi:nitrilase
MSTSKTSSSSKITVAVAQIASTFDVVAAVDQVASYIEEAAQASAHLIVFPEATIGGYPKFHTFGTSIGDQTLEGRAIFEGYSSGTVTVPGPEITRIAEIAQRTNIFVVVGVIERSTESTTLYGTVVYIDPEKGYVGKHRKIMPTGSERLIWGQGDGSTLDVFEPTNTPGGIVCASICWENYMPLMRYNMYSKCVNIYCAPTVDSSDSWPITMQHIAREGRTFVLSACQFARRWDFPGIWKTAGYQEEELIKGGSMIVNPLGEMLAGPLRGTEGLLLADIDLGACIQGKFDLDVVGHYARYSSLLIILTNSGVIYLNYLLIQIRLASKC